MKRILFYSIIFLLFNFFNSCNTKDFDLKKLSTSDLSPKVYAPLAYGTFTIKDYLSVNLGSDNTLITIPQVQLDPLTWRKGDFALQPAALDSAFMEVTLTNGSPMKVNFDISFMDYNSGVTSGRSFSGNIDQAIYNNGTIEPTTKKFVFPLTTNDLEVIKTSDGLMCAVTLMQSGSSVTVGSVKNSEFKIQVNFLSKVYLGKLQ